MDTGVMKRTERLLEGVLFASRWLLAPFYIGLILAIVVLLIKFVGEFSHLVPLALGGGSGDTIVIILSLVDLALVANLLLIIVFAGYENFVSKINTGDSEDRPEWMGHVDFSDLKIKLIGSIVAISGIELLKVFLHSEELTNDQLMWKVIIHLTFVLSGVLFAVMDWLGGEKKKKRASEAAAG